jgi:hypothetical protein
MQVHGDSPNSSAITAEVRSLSPDVTCHNGITGMVVPAIKTTHDAQIIRLTYYQI